MNTSLFVTMSLEIVEDRADKARSHQNTRIHTNSQGEKDARFAFLEVFSCELDRSNRDASQPRGFLSAARQKKTKTRTK